MLCYRYCFRLIDVLYCSAKLDGSILGKNTKVGVKSELIRCITQAGYEVVTGGRYCDYSFLSTVIDIWLQRAANTRSSTCLTGRLHPKRGKTRMAKMKKTKARPGLVKTAKTLHNCQTQTDADVLK
jgi:hypothetical protein